MTDVYLPYRDSLFVEVYDSESPWKTRVVIDPLIISWLDLHCSAEWDWDDDENYEGLIFSFSEIDSKIATMFKLAWG